MTKIRLQKTIGSLLLVASMPAWSAIFGSSGTAAPETPAPMPAATAPSAPSAQAAQAVQTAVGQVSPTLAAQAANVSPEDMEALKQAAVEFQNDPGKLEDIIKKMNALSAKDNSNSAEIAPKAAGASSTTSMASLSSTGDELEQAQAQLDVLQNKAERKFDSSIDDPAFQFLLQKALPLSPDQIKFMHKLYDITQAAGAETPNTPPTPMSSSSLVHLDPGNTPPVIRLSAGFVTSLVFTDSTGAPWPIASYTLGDPTAFNIQWDQRSNSLFVQSIKLYSHGNLAVTLHGLSTPVMISMVSGQKQVDFRIDFQVAGRGPEASAPIMPESYQDAKVNPILINVLDGIPPKGSIKLNVAGNLGEAWVHENTLYFRTRLTVLSPAWTGTVSSPDGMHVYEMTNTPTILASKDGQTIDIRLTGL